MSPFFLVSLDQQYHLVFHQSTFGQERDTKTSAGPDLALRHIPVGFWSLEEKIKLSTFKPWEISFKNFEGLSCKHRKFGNTGPFKLVQIPGAENYMLH